MAVIATAWTRNTERARLEYAMKLEDTDHPEWTREDALRGAVYQNMDAEDQGIPDRLSVVRFTDGSKHQVIGTMGYRESDGTIIVVSDPIPRTE